jgi:hypothetical protein
MSIRFKAPATKSGIGSRMSFDRLKSASNSAVSKIKNIEIKDKIAGALPQSGDEVGKHIEHRLNESRKVWSNSGMVLFSKRALDSMALNPKVGRGVIMLLLTVLILIFPTERSLFHFGVIAKNFLLVLLGLVVTEAVTYGVMKAFGSETKIGTYFSTVNTAVLMSLVLVSLPIAIVAFAIFSITIRSESAVAMFFTLMPFYNYLIFGWSSENLSGLKGVRAIVLALIALLVLLFFNLFIPMLM